MRTFLATLLLAACTTSNPPTSIDDESMFLTGDEEVAVLRPNGVVECEDPKKQLVCHIPPGNPDNAHEICVSVNAVDKHQAQHGDLLGPCDGDGDDDDGGGDGDGGGGTDTAPIP